ncbi:hypothetical protein PFISCL1PPCAC_15746, partial [Pristionchus fissidentatus]
CSSADIFLIRSIMPPGNGKSSSSHDDVHRHRTVSSRVNVSLLLELRKREWSSWDEMLDCPVDWIEPIANGESKNGDDNGDADKTSETNGTIDHEDELLQEEMEVEECRTDESRVMTKLRRGVLEIGPTMSRLRSNTFSSCCLDRLVIMHCSCGEVVKREAYGTHHRMKHTARGSAPGSPTTSNGSVPSTPLSLQPPPPSKVPVHAKSTPPRLIQKRPSPKVVPPPSNHNHNNNHIEKKPRLAPPPPSRIESQDWKVLNEDGGTKLRIVRINPTSQSTTTTVPKGGGVETGRTPEGTSAFVQLAPPPPICTVSPSPPSSVVGPSEERLVSPRDRRAAHREEVRLTRPANPKRIRLTPPPHVPIVAREEETTTSTSVRVSTHPTTVPLYRQSPSDPSTPSPSHPSTPLLISTSSSSIIHPSQSRFPSHSSPMGGVHQRLSPHSPATITYTNEHGQKVYLMPRATNQMKQHVSLHPQQSMHGGVHPQGSQGGGGGGPPAPINIPPNGQRQTIVIVLPPGARSRNGPIVLPPGTTLRAIPSSASSSSSSSLPGGMGVQSGQPPVHYISHTPLPPTTRRLEIPSTSYTHHRLMQHNPSSTVSHHHQPHHHPHLQQTQTQQVLLQQPQHHSVSSSGPQYQYQMMNHGGDQYHGHHSDQMGSRMMMGGQQGYGGVPRVINQGMQRVMEQRRVVHTPSPPPTLQPMPVLRAQLMEDNARGRIKKSNSPSMVSSSTVDSPSHQPSSSTGSKMEGGMGHSALYEALHGDHPERGIVAREEVVSMVEMEEDEDDAMPVLECHSTFNEEGGEFGREEEEMPETLEECDSSTTFSTLPSSSTN